MSVHTCPACLHTTEAGSLVLYLDYDSDCENPCDMDGAWRLVSFSDRHIGYEDRELHFPDGHPTIGLRRKLEVGTAFLLSYFQHGGCAWSLLGEGNNCPWDSTRYAGLLLWEHLAGDMGAKTLQERAKDARGFLETYNAWANGDCYGYSLRDESGAEVDSCWGFYGPDLSYMAEVIRAAAEGKPLKVIGPAAGIATYHQFS